jgi:hypothetical protein
VRVPTKLTLSLAVAGLLALFTAGPAQAALTVTNTNDSGAGSLRQAIAEAGPGETINLPAGTYTLTSEELKVTKSVTIAGHDDADTIIRSGGPFRVFIVFGSIDATISGVTIRDGAVAGPFGGGILSAEANLSLRDVTVTRNTVNATGTPGKPGGVAVGAGIAVVEGKLTMADSTVTENASIAVGGSAAKGGVAFGAGLYVAGGFDIANSTISGNLADARGGQGPSNPAQVGGVTEAAGALLSQLGKEPASLVGSTISGNVSDSSAGPGGTGGIGISAGTITDTDEGTMRILNTTIAANVIRNQGDGALISEGAGMISSGEEGAPIEVLGSTIAANRIEATTGLMFGANLVAEDHNSIFGNTIVADGVGAPGSENCAGAEFTEAPTSLGFNIESLDQCRFKGPGDRVSTNPLLGPLALNGGLTQTMAPGIGSPAIDQGKSFGLTTDQRGVMRPIELPSIPNSTAEGADGSDIGAVEVQPSNAFTLGKFAKNKKKGTATLAVTLPAPSAGTLTLSGKGLKTQTLAITGQTEVKLKVAAKSKAVKKALRKKGKRKVQIDVAYAPTGNAPATQSRKAKLIKKKKKKRSKSAKK